MSKPTHVDIPMMPMGDIKTMRASLLSQEEKIVKIEMLNERFEVIGTAYMNKESVSDDVADQLQTVFEDYEKAGT